MIWIPVVYIACGLITLWACKQDMTADHWYNWFIVILIWPYFLFVAVSAERP